MAGTALHSVYLAPYVTCALPICTCCENIQLALTVPFYIVAALLSNSSSSEKKKKKKKKPFPRHIHCLGASLLVSLSCPRLRLPRRLTVEPKCTTDPCSAWLPLLPLPVDCQLQPAVHTSRVHFRTALHQRYSMSSTYNSKSSQISNTLGPA